MSNNLVNITTAASVRLSRRRAIRVAALGLTSMGLLDLEAAQHVHAAATDEKKSGPYKPKELLAEEYRTLVRLAELIVPADSVSGSAVDAGAPEFIDLLCSQNEKLADIYHGGLAWLDAEMRNRVGKRFVEATEAQQKAMLDALVAAETAETERMQEQRAYQRSAIYKDFSGYTTRRPGPLGPGVFFFDWVRKMTVDAFYTSPIGTKDLDFRGNRAYSRYTVPKEALDYAMRRSPFKG